MSLSRRLVPAALWAATVTVLLLVVERPARSQASTVTQFRNPRVQSARLLLDSGARPKWLSTGDRIVYDRRNTDGLYDLYIADRAGTILNSVTAGQPIPQLHNGNGIFRRTRDYIIFQSEEQPHWLDWAAPFGRVPFGEPGLGLFNNFWATNGTQFWRLTNAPIKQTADDGIPAVATVNPRLAPDNQTLVWSERYAEGGNHNWGRWRLKTAQFKVGANGPYLEGERVLYTPTTGNWITAMEVLSYGGLLVSGNLDGQHEYGMDLYLLWPSTGQRFNLTRSPTAWEEGSCVAPSSGRIVYMTNRDSPFPIDTTKPWQQQPIERDYWLMNSDGTGKERLTYFNDSSAPEFLNFRAVTIVCSISPDGQTIAATIGRDFGDDANPQVWWQTWLIEMKEPL